MSLPLLISVPHAGLRVPPEVEPYCILTFQQIEKDSDEGAAQVYAIADKVAVFVTTEIAWAIVDVNRAEDDRRADGVVKTHTCWNVPVYGEFPPDDVIESLLPLYYRPYHARLTEVAHLHVCLGVDCHTMAAYGPPVGPDPDVERPWVCLGNVGGTCPNTWIHPLAIRFDAAFDHPVSVNDPFHGGYITRTHASELPWVQFELSRAPFMSNEEKRVRVVEALRTWCDHVPI